MTAGHMHTAHKNTKKLELPKIQIIFQLTVSIKVYVTLD